MVSTLPLLRGQSSLCNELPENCVHTSTQSHTQSGVPVPRPPQCDTRLPADLGPEILDGCDQCNLQSSDVRVEVVLLHSSALDDPSQLLEGTAADVPRLLVVLQGQLYLTDLLRQVTHQRQLNTGRHANSHSSTTLAVPHVHWWSLLECLFKSCFIDGST